MQPLEGFLGEIEFAGPAVPESSFGHFEQLENIENIHALAHEFSQQLELMPNQTVGEPMKLLVSVYVYSLSVPGRVIAVLARSDYPQDWDELREIVQLAQERVKLLWQLQDQFDEASIRSAADALQRLSRKLAEAASPLS